MKRLAAIATGLAIGAALWGFGPAAAAEVSGWWTESNGVASGSMASLAPLEVSDAKGGDRLFPGQTLALKVQVKNPNPVPLTLAAVEIGDLKSEDGACDDTLAGSRLRFDRTPDIVVQPGTNDGVVLGSIKLPKLLANSCQGKDVSAEVQVRAAYGATG
jgi:hypothetical protein